MAWDSIITKVAPTPAPAEHEAVRSGAGGQEGGADGGATDRGDPPKARPFVSSLDLDLDLEDMEDTAVLTFDASGELLDREDDTAGRSGDVQEEASEDALELILEEDEQEEARTGSWRPARVGAPPAVEAHGPGGQGELGHHEVGDPRTATPYPGAVDVRTATPYPGGAWPAPGYAPQATPMPGVHPGLPDDYWDDQPTTAYRGRPTMGDMGEPAQRTTAPSALVLHPSVDSLDAYAPLLGGVLASVRPSQVGVTLPEPPPVPTLLEPDSLPANRYRTLGNRVEDAASRGLCRIIGVTSPKAGDGKTLTAINLAMILAEEPTRRVGLVDCNLRHPEVAEVLGIERTPGLVGLYRREISLIDAMVKLPDRELYVLQAGEAHPNPSEVLRSRVLAAVLRRLEVDLDILVLDTPAMIPAADVGLLSRLVDKFIVVVRAGYTRRTDLAQALAQLDESKYLGLVFNEVEG